MDKDKFVYIETENQILYVGQTRQHYNLKFMKQE
jgi:hypothetical protein